MASLLMAGALNVAQGGWAFPKGGPCLLACMSHCTAHVESRSLSTLTRLRWH